LQATSKDVHTQIKTNNNCSGNNNNVVNYSTTTAAAAAAYNGLQSLDGVMTSPTVVDTSTEGDIKRPNFASPQTFPRPTVGFPPIATEFQVKCLVLASQTTRGLTLPNTG
jgi:hypothetical protein